MCLYSVCLSLKGGKLMPAPPPAGPPSTGTYK